MVAESVAVVGAGGVAVLAAKEGPHREGYGDTLDDIRGSLGWRVYADATRLACSRNAALWP